MVEIFRKTREESCGYPYINRGKDDFVSYQLRFPHSYPQFFHSNNLVVCRLNRNFATTMKKLRTIEMQRLSVEEFKEADKLPLIVVLDDVRSMHNVGSVFRTGDAFRIEAVYLCGITSTPPMAEIHKTALGAEDSVSWKYFPTAMEALNSLKADGYEVYAIEQAHGSTMLQDFKPQADQKYAIILGNEVKGVHQEVVDACDGCLEIPQFGTKHSMNVSVTGGIVIWHFAKTKL
jgi:tRNA G18 (ribose-2'-O)-methylase SpoU